MIALFDAIWQISSITTFVVLISLFVEITLKIKSKEDIGKMYFEGILGLLSIIIFSAQSKNIFRYVGYIIAITMILLIVSTFLGMQLIADYLMLLETIIFLVIVTSICISSLIISIFLTVNEVICLSVDGDCISGRMYFISHATFLLMVIPICIFFAKILINY